MLDDGVAVLIASDTEDTQKENSASLCTQSSTIRGDRTNLKNLLYEP